MDDKKALKHLLHAPADHAVLVEVPDMQFLTVDGRGDPNTAAAFGEAVEALYALSYALKFMLKKEGSGVDYSVAPLEGLWSADDMERFSLGDKEAWQWTVMIRQPDFITGEHFRRAADQVRQKKNPAALSRLRLETFGEGLCAQIMHIGPYAAEHPTVERLHAFIRENGYMPHGRHHEIYLGDPRRSAPEKLKTLIRQPARRP